MLTNWNLNINSKKKKKRPLDLTTWKLLEIQKRALAEWRWGEKPVYSEFERESKERNWQ